MTVEQNLKSIIGEQVFQLCSLSTQLEEAHKQIKDLQDRLNKQGETDASVS
jgi:hypothetical protein